MSAKSRLITIFNANDPTPTARTLRNTEWDKAHVLIVGGGRYRRHQKNNLRRLKSWASGTSRHYSKAEGDSWPDAIWKDEWNWTPISTENIDYCDISEIVSDLFDIQDGDTIDLTSGTKEMTADLIRLANASEKNVVFLVQTRSGHTLNLSTGELQQNSNDLSARERIWLSSGYIVDFPGVGNADYGKIWEASKKMQEVSNSPSSRLDRSDAIGLGDPITKIIPVVEEIIPKLGGNKKQHQLKDLNSGFWLEHTSAHLLATWPDVVDCYIGPRLINPSFNESLGVALFTIFQNLKVRKRFPPGLFKQTRTKEEYLALKEYRENYFRGSELPPAALHSLFQSIHAVEFDFLAVTKTSFIVGECKHMNCVDAGMLGRLLSNTKGMFPIHSVPVLVYSGPECMHVSGVNLISWPRLSDPTILDLIQEDEVEKLSFEFTPSDKESKSSVKVDSDSAFEQTSLTGTQKDSVIEGLLSSIKFAPPMRYNPEFINLLNRFGLTDTQGLLRYINEKFSEKLGFTINTSKHNTTEWIVWNDEEE